MLGRTHAQPWWPVTGFPADPTEVGQRVPPSPCPSFVLPYAATEPRRPARPRFTHGASLRGEVRACLRGERYGSRSAERAGDLGEDGEVGVQANPLDASGS